MSALKTIEEQWHGFSEMVFRKTPAGEVQRLEMKKAFFAGAWSLHSAMMEIGEPHVSEAQGEAYLTAVQEECRQFSKRLMAEYAEMN